MQIRGTIPLLAFFLQLPVFAFIELINLSHTADPESSFTNGHLIALAFGLVATLVFGFPALVQCVTLRGREDFSVRRARVAAGLFALEAVAIVSCTVVLLRF